MTKQEHLLVVLMEEAAEVSQAVSKILRFGQTKDNTDRLISELNDYQAAIYMLQDEVILPETYIDSNKIIEKKNKVKFYMGDDK